MNIANKTLTALQTKEIFTEIFTDHFNLSFYGFIRNFNDHFLLLEHYNEDGFYNGIIIFRRADITRIKWDNNDLNSAFKLIARQKEVKEIAEINIESMETIIRSVEKAYKHVNLQIQNADDEWSVIGQVIVMDADTIIVKEFGTMSSLDKGMLMLPIDDITRVDAGGIYENNLMKILNSAK